MLEGGLLNCRAPEAESLCDKEVHVTKYYGKNHHMITQKPFENFLFSMEEHKSLQSFY